MPETFVADITYGLWAYGTATETITGVTRKTIQAVSGAVDPSAGYALYLPFSAASPTYRSGATTSPLITAMPGYAYTRSGAKQELLASAGGVSAVFAANVPGIVPGQGYYSWVAETNLLLNAGQSSNLGTQNVTVTAQAYTLSFLGTGTVTLSGVSVAGPLVGTGVNNQVSLTFTPTAGTLTLTVTGNVTYSGLVAGLATGPIIATAGATASTGADSLAETITALTDQDMLIWVTGTCQDNSGNTATSFALDDNTTNNEITFFHTAGGGVGFIRVWVGGALQYNQDPGTQAVGVKHTRLLRRIGGNWRGGKVVSGVLTWASADVAGTFPAGLTNIRSGQQRGNPAFNGSVAGEFIKFGTFAIDADVLSAVAAPGV